MIQVAASAVETTGSKAALKAAFGILMTAEAPKVGFCTANWACPWCTRLIAVACLIIVLQADVPKGDCVRCHAAPARLKEVEGIRWSTH